MSNTPAERSRRLSARWDSTEQSMAAAPPPQIDAAVLCYMTLTNEEKYDNGPGPKRIEKGDLCSIQGPESGCGLPKK